MSEAKKQHVDFQRSYFDHNVDVFLQPIPGDVLERSREIVRTIVAGSSVRILDVGTGIGAFLKHYHEEGVPFANMLGCDLSSEMLREAKRRYPDVQFWQGDILNFPERSGSFDLVVFNACFGNIFDQFAVLKKSRALLNASGRIAISHPMGNTFVKKLKAAEPDLVFSLLPEKGTLESWSAGLQMQLTVFRDEANLYLAVLQLSSNLLD